MTLPNQPPVSPSGRVVRAFYLATPLFVLADLVLGVNVRTSFLDATPALKWTYYAVAFAAGVCSWAWPRWTGYIGLGESTLNIALLVFSIGAAYLRLAESVEHGTDAGLFTTESMLNLMLSAMMLIFSYLASHARIADDLRRRQGR